MNHRSWAYYDKKGTIHRIGMMHGEESGNFMAYWNGEIVYIDFQIFHSKRFSFFINEVLFEIAITKKGEEYDYDFDYHDDKKKEGKKKYRKISAKTSNWLIGSASVLLVIGMVFLFSYFQTAHRENHLGQYGMDNTGRVELVYKNNQVKSIIVHYDYKGRSFSSKAFKLENIQTPFHFPLNTGDLVNVRHSYLDPFVMAVKWETVPKEMEERYFDMAYQQHFASHDGLPENQVVCEVNLAYQTDGLSGLADIYYQEVLPENAPLQHHRQTYLKLTRRIPYIEGKRACFGE